MRNLYNQKINIVIGSSLRALIYCLQYNHKLLYTQVKVPSMIDSPVTFLGKRYAPLDLWNRIYFILSIQGNILFSDKVDSLRLEGSSISVFSKRARKYQLEFEKIFIFDDHKLTGFPNECQAPPEKVYEVRDWLSVRSGMKHDHDALYSGDSFVKEVIFYYTDRVDGDHKLKDAVAISYLTDEQMSEYEYSDINARFKTVHLMKKAGIRGTRNGRDQKNKNRYKYYAIKLENQYREVVCKLKRYTSTDKIIFNFDTIDDIIFKTSVDCNEPRIFNRYT